MEKSDLGIVNIIGNKLDDLSLYPYLSQENIEGVFYYDYANYSLHNGEILFVNNKPVVTARYNLWGGFESSYSLASKINASSVVFLSISLLSIFKSSIS